MSDHVLTIRAATPRDSRPRMRGPALLAERDGVPIAAIALTSGTVVVDPFSPTEDAVALLRSRRYRLLRQGGDVAPVRSLLRRLAPQPAASSA
jgi:hypothetical protein